MNNCGIMLISVLLMILPDCVNASNGDSDGMAYADEPEQQAGRTSGMFGPGTTLEDKGIDIDLGVTQIYQQNVHGGLSTHRRAGRFSGSYDVEVSADFDRLLGIKGGSVHMLTEGSWPKSAGIDEPAVGSFFGVNGDAVARRVIDVTELWYEQGLWDNSLHLRLGKIDLTGGLEHQGCPVAFDCGTYANDETTQFLNNALINNPTIPFPDNGLGVVVHYSSDSLWYLSAAIADAQADRRETGFATAFSGEDYFLYILETGVTPQFDSANGPLQGAYRFGLWYDPQDKQQFSNGKTKRDDTGLYLTFDQMLFKENNVPQDSQGIGAFFRYGWADSAVNEITNFYSAGLQYQGLLPGRDEDVVALGFARGIFSNSAVQFTEDYESAYEFYYSFKLSPSAALSPAVQYMQNPGGDGTDDVVVLAARLQISF